jgi:hypothetical protein
MTWVCRNRAGHVKTQQGGKPRNGRSSSLSFISAKLIKRPRIPTNALVAQTERQNAHPHPISAKVYV